MAQYKASDLAGAKSAFMQAFGNTVTQVDVVTPSAALATNDTVDLVRIAGGTKLFSLQTFNGDFDTGTSLQVKIGYRKVNSGDVLGGGLVEDDDFFGAALTTWQAAVLSSSPTKWAFNPITFNCDVYITATVTAGAAGVSGTPSITAIAQGVAVGIK